MTWQGPTVEALLEQLRKLHPSRPCPRWAVLGPRYSGKSQFLKEFTQQCRAAQDNRAPLPLYVDLKQIPLGTEQRMYRSVFQQLDEVCRDLPFEISSEGPPDGTGRFDHFVGDLLTKAKSRVALVVDHLDAVPHFFGRSLIRRFRLMVDQEDLRTEFKSLCLLLAGTTSLFDLRREGDSTFLASNLIFPQHNESAWRCRFGTNGLVSDAVKAKIRNATGGETLFLDLLFDALGAETPLTEAAIDTAIETILNAPERPDTFHQIVLEIASDRDLRRLVRDISSSPSRRIIRRDLSPDIDRFCLSGVVILDHEQALAYYRFRNEIVARFVRRLIDDARAEYVHFPSVAQLKDVRAECYQSREIYGSLRRLFSAWEACVFGIRRPTSMWLHVAYEDGTEAWIDPARRQASVAAAMGPASVKQAIQQANEPSAGHLSFGFDEQSISLAISFARAEASLELVLTFPRDMGQGLNETSLSHWLRLLDDCWPSLASAALSELSVHFLKRSHGSSARGDKVVREPETRIHWGSSFGVIIDKPGECSHYEIGRTSEEMSRAAADMNQRCLRLMRPRQSAADFAGELRGVGEQFRTFLERCPKLGEQLCAPGANLVFLSEVSGLQLPLELFPIHASYLAQESRIARRIHRVPVPATTRSFAASINALIERSEPLNVLIAGADTHDTLKNLDAELNQLKLRIEAGAKARGLRVNVRVLDPLEATYEALDDALKDKKYQPCHVFHFCGHGEHGRVADESSLVLRGKRGEDRHVSCDQLRLLLSDHGLWLAYLSCCYGAAASGDTALDQQYVGSIQAVLEARVPNAVGFRWAVTDTGAYALATNFYTNLFSPEGTFDLSDAMWKARRSVAADESTRDACASALLISQCG